MQRSRNTLKGLSKGEDDRIHLKAHRFQSGWNEFSHVVKKPEAAVIDRQEDQHLLLDQLRGPKSLVFVYTYYNVRSCDPSVDAPFTA